LKEINLKNRKKYKLSIISAALIILIIVIIFSLSTGTIEIKISEIIEIFRGGLKNTFVWHIVTNVRLPRILTGVLVGINLAISGVLLQGILRNPIASPNIIGVNAGAGLAAVAIMTLFPGKMNFIPFAAFGGALLATLLIYILATRSSSASSTVHIVLAGVAVSSILGALTSALMMLNSDVLEISYSWLQGSLSGRSWTSFKMIWPYTLLGLFISIIISPKINLFSLGDEMAGSIGLPTKFYRTLIILTSSILAGSAVSVAGTIGFVGLIAPHAARLFIGNDHRYLVPLSALFGAILLVLSDTLARTLFQPIELSVGIITSILGGPFFLFLLYKKGKIQINK
jgi:iron complex transport system permease protein